jgi:hypothetical protein
MFHHLAAWPSVRIVDGWRQGDMADTGENVGLAIEALALRAALIEAGMIPQTA